MKIREKLIFCEFATNYFLLMEFASDDCLTKEFVTLEVRTLRNK